MSFSFRPGVRENVGLIVGLAGPSGAGKTFSAMRLASGIVGAGKRFAVIDTEARRALHYADRFAFDHAELRPPFKPDAYVEAIKAADSAGYVAIVVDSISHEHAGEGGVLDWHEQELERMAGQDWAKRERVKMAAWIKPKMAHKAMVQRLLQVRAHLILCMRAEERVKIEKGEDGKQKIVPQGWQPVCGKDFPYELTVSLLLTPDKPGVPIPLKLQEQHRVIFPDGKPIDEEAGRRLSVWANGSAPAAPASSPEPPAPGPSTPTSKPLAPPTDRQDRFLYDTAMREARKGLDALREWWSAQTADTKKVLLPYSAQISAFAKRVDAGEIIDEPATEGELEAAS